MSNIMQSITCEEFEQDIAVEINGETYDLPRRTGELDNKLAEIEKKRASMREYDFIAENIEAIFGKTNAKKIIKDGIKTNLDYMAKVYTASMELIYAEKIQAEKENTESKMEMITPLLDKISKAGPVITKLK